MLKFNIHAAIDSMMEFHKARTAKGFCFTSIVGNAKGVFVTGRDKGSTTQRNYFLPREKGAQWEELDSGQI